MFFTLKDNITVPAGITLVIPSYCKLTVPSGLAVAEGGKLTVKGVISGDGTIDVGGDIVIESGGKINAKTTKGKGTLKVMKGGTLITDYGDGRTPCRNREQERRRCERYAVNYW